MGSCYLQQWKEPIKTNSLRQNLVEEKEEIMVVIDGAVGQWLRVFPALCSDCWSLSSVKSGYHWFQSLNTIFKQEISKIHNCSEKVCTK